MLDDGPRNAPPDWPPLDPVGTEPDDAFQEVGAAPAEEVRAAPAEEATAPAAEATALAGATTPAAASATALLKADVSDAWTKLDQSARLLVGASAAAIVVLLVGLPLSVWDSAPFALLVLTAGIITAVTGWFGASKAFRDSPIPRSTIELVATLVVLALATLKLIEILFDLDSAGIVALVVGAALAAAGVGQVLAAQQRGADPLAFSRGDQGTKIAAVGLALVLIGWVLNLSVSFWTMGQAALPIAILTIAALTVAEAPRIQSPVPVAWVGAGIGAFGAVLALAHWADLMNLGRTRLVLDPSHFIGPLAFSIGIALVIAGGALSGRAVWAISRPASPDVVEG
jgi:hypothetical protein